MARESSLNLIAVRMDGGGEPMDVIAALLIAGDVRDEASDRVAQDPDVFGLV